MKKEVLSQLKKLAGKLPLTYQRGIKYQKSTIKDLRGREVRNTALYSPVLTNEDLSLTIEQEPETITLKKEVLYKVNHHRRLKKAYEKNGVQGIRDYYKWVDNNNKILNAEFENKIVFDVVSEKVKASIGNIFL